MEESKTIFPSLSIFTTAFAPESGRTKGIATQLFASLANGDFGSHCFSHLRFFHCEASRLMNNSITVSPLETSRSKAIPEKPICIKGTPRTGASNLSMTPLVTIFRTEGITSTRPSLRTAVTTPGTAVSNELSLSSTTFSMAPRICPTMSLIPQPPLRPRSGLRNCCP